MAQSQDRFGTRRTLKSSHGSWDFFSLEKLEEIATSFKGVESAYAIQAGREIRVIVDANQIDDESAMKIARDIAIKVEQDMTYPGEIQVTLLREVRCIEYAK